MKIITHNHEKKTKLSSPWACVYKHGSYDLLMAVARHSCGHERVDNLICKSEQAT